MGKGVRVGIVVEIVVLAAAIVLSVACFRLGLFKSNNGVDLWLLIVWVLVAAVMLFVFWWRSLTREEIVRRFYLSREGVYNHEIGYAPLSRVAPDLDAYQFVSFAAGSLVNMSYGFEVADPPDDFSPELVISTKTFQFSRSKDEEGDGSIVESWSGQLLKVGNPGDEDTYEVLGSYENARDLARLLEDNQAL